MELVCKPPRHFAYQKYAAHITPASSKEVSGGQSFASGDRRYTTTIAIQSQPRIVRLGVALSSIFMGLWGRVFLIP